MNPIKSILERAQKLVTMGLGRKPQEYLYLDRRSLEEHYQATTGTARVPRGTRETMRATLDATIPIINWGVGGQLESTFELSDYHLFESLEPELRKLPVAKQAADFEASLRGFIWLSGRLSWSRMGAEGKDATLSYIIECADMPFMLLCRDESFSPFAPFFNPQTIHLYKMAFEVEVLAYNPGILGQYFGSPHQSAGMALALVPTVILITDAERRADIAEWIKKLNHGQISRPYDSRRRS
jgi:hypothetical protein